MLFEAMNFVPWLIDGPVVKPKAGWEPTTGCKACDEVRSGVRRRGRPFHRSPECSTRQADFWERLREMKVLSACAVSLVMERHCRNFELQIW